MPVSIPDYSALGFGDPRSVGNLPTFPQESAAAVGEAALGKGLEKAGTAAMTVDAYGQMAKNKLDQATATNDLFVRLSPLLEQVSKETDPTKLADLRNQINGLTGISGQAIASPDARTLWTATHGPTISKALAEADARGTVLDRNSANAKIFAQGDQLVRTGAAADDPQALGIARQGLKDLAEYGTQYGSLTPTQAYEWQKKSLADLTAGRIDSLAAKGRTNEALALLNENRADLGAVAAANLEARIQHRATAADGDALANGALGLAPMPTPRSIGGMAVGGAISRGVAAEAQQQNFDPATALATAHIESSMGRNLGARGNVFQLGAPEWASVGGGNMADFGTQIRNGVAFLSKTEQGLADRLGRKPEPWEIYLAHQQGVAGATALLSHPDTPAGQLVGDKAISANGGDPSAPASAFVDKWRGTFNHNLSLYGGGNSASAAPAAGVAGFDLAAGDSIAVGSIRHGGVPGNAVTLVSNQGADGADAAGGRNPQQALAYISANPDRFAGKNVLWSSGLMNATDPQAALATVGQQLDALKATGANPVLVGVDQGKFATYNTALQAIADEKGVPFAGPLPTKSVHPGPQGYKQYAAAAAKLIAQPAAASGTQAEQFAASAAQPTGAGNAGIVPVGAPDQAQSPAPATAPAQLIPAMPPQPAPPPPGSPPNRTGLPPLSEVWERIYNTPGYSPEARMQAWQKATTRYNALEADAARAERIQTQRQAQALRQRENEIWADVYNPNPTITAQQIAVDPAFDGHPDRRKFMIELINNPPGSGVPAAQSYAAAQSLIERMRLPEGDPNKITDEGQIYDQMHSLNRADLEFTLKKLNDIRSPGGEKFAQREAQFIKGIGAQIDKSNPLLGSVDETGKQKLYEYQWALDQKVEQYRKAGKDPNDLLDPSKPEYMGKPEALAPFQKTMEESAADIAKRLANPTNAAPRPVITPPAPPPEFVGPAGSTPTPGGISVPLPAVPGGAIPPRQPGETPDQYMKRIGR